MSLPKSNPPDPKQMREWRQWVDKLLDTSLMTDYEQHFVENMSLKLDQGYPLTLKQAEVLEQIYVKKG